ncbi:MAG: leucine-rich repeat protein [Oscillospiraceae bacterium]|nr:leucine-rich repeat protein [Oscillospiraceae bacterium]MBR0392564.1 leucine-rich repeat protein [Oscillospiraceae bacterium]
MIDHENYVNTIDALGDDVLTDAILTRSFPETFSGDLIDDKVVKVGSYSLYGANDIVNAYFPLATIVQTYGFGYALNLLSVDLPECLEVANGGFQHCEKLIEVNMPKLTRLNSNAFQYCKKLTEIHLPEATSVPSYTFGDCLELEVVDLPKVLNAQGSSFLNCRKLKTVILPSATYIVAPFMQCPALEKVYLPAIEQLGTNCFNQSNALQEINLGPNITKIDANAFSGMPNGVVINIPVEEGVITGAPWGGTGATINYAHPYVGPNGETLDEEGEDQ